VRQRGLLEHRNFSKFLELLPEHNRNAHLPYAAEMRCLAGAA